jgi:CubicO group peptidase (beta-lactamase class C family)
MMRWCRLAVLMSLVTLPLSGQVDQAAWRAAVEALDRYAAADATVGAALVLVHDGEIVREHYHGFADRDRGIRADRGTIWHWGSITKTFTAIAVMQQVGLGRIQLDQPATELIPELRRIHNPFGSMSDVTVGHLLSHSSGLQAGTWPWTRGQSWEPFEPTEWQQLVAMMPYMRLAFRPGERYSYSNPAIVYLARMVELTSGDPWQGYIAKNFFLPLDFEASYFGTTPRPFAARRSHNYSRTDSGVVDHGPDFDPGITIPNGGLNAPVSDLARWMAFLMGSDDPSRQALFDSILPREVLEQMWQPRQRVDDEEEMGLSFFIRRGGNGRMVGHTGTQANFRSFFWLDPDRRIGIIGVVNTSSNVDTRASTEGFNLLMQKAREAATEVRSKK